MAGTHQRRTVRLNKLTPKTKEMFSTLSVNSQTKQEMQCTYKRNIEARSRNHCCHGKAINVYCIFCVCVCVCVCAASIMQHAKHTRCIILSSVACPALQYFSTLSQKRQKFLEKKKEERITGRKMCVLSFSTNFVRNISHSWDIVISLLATELFFFNFSTPCI